MSGQVFFSVSDGLLTIVSGDGVNLWAGLPDGMRVLDLRVDRGGRSVIALLDPPRGVGRVRNLVRITSSGEVAWRGDLPDAGAVDAFVGFTVEFDGNVLASTWTGYQVRLDPETGSSLGQDFVK